MSLPQRRLPEADRAAGWKIRLSYSPSPQLPPVKLRLPKLLWRGLDIPGRGSRKDPGGDLGGLPTQGVNRKERTPHKALAELIVEPSEYRRVGDRVQPGENLLLSIGNALRVDDEVAEINRGGRRQSGDPLWISLNDKSFMKTGLTRLSNGRSARRNSFTQNFSIGASPITTASVVVFGSVRRMFSMTSLRSIETATIVSSAVTSPDRSLVKGGKNNGRRRKEISLVALNEPRRRTDHGNDQVGRMVREKGSQIAHERFIPLAVGEARDLERHLEAVYRISRFLSQIGTQISRECVLGLKICAERVQQQHSLRLRSRHVPCGKSQQSSCYRRAARPSHGYSGNQLLSVSIGGIKVPIL